MKNWIFGILILIILVFLSLYYWKFKKQPGRLDPSLNIKSNTMNLQTKSFLNNGDMPAKFTCDGDNINPDLEINGVPPETKSLVLIVDDPDAPSGTWTHWTMWNIDPKTLEIAENSVVKDAVQGTTSDGSQGYHGPCPPSGVHRYLFKLYALDTPLVLGPNARVDELTKGISGHVLSQAELIGKYSRKK